MYVIYIYIILLLYLIVYISFNKLSQLGTVLLEKPTATNLLKTFVTSHEIGRSITTYAEYKHCPDVNQMNPVRSLVSYLSSLYFKYTLPLTLKSLKWSLIFGFLTNSACTCISHSPHACLSHSLSCLRSNKISPL